MTASAPRAQSDQDPYARIAEWYDLEHDGFTDDIELYLELIGGSTRRLAILEVGSGTGRLLAALAEAGNVVTGVEPSAAMRERCVRRMAALPDRVARRISVVEGSATALNLPEADRFDVALLGLGTFGHLTRPEERAAALGAIHAHLRAGGSLIVDVDLAGPRRLLETSGRLWWQGAWPTSDGATLIEHLVVGGPGTEPGVVEVTHLYDTHEQSGPVHRTLTRTPLALLSRGEVALALQQAGFRIEALYGGYDMAPADDSAGRVIAFAQRPDSSG
ncbi:MAG TPA: class I SAM-dependent methyltransferase [Ktedonobacterales bacterium]|nr:class I SAM-dependent methyltransferase [Ktedonobacterales bacterium]